MTSPPTWLPGLISTNGEYDEIIGRLYSVFKNGFKENPCSFQGRPVWWNRNVEAGDSYENGFWKIITRTDRSTGDRLLEPRRAERIAWCSAVINNCDDNEVIVWDFKESNGEIRSYLWLEKWDYVVILMKKDLRNYNVAFLVTAYHVDGPSTRRRLRKKYSNRVIP